MSVDALNDWVEDKDLTPEQKLGLKAKELRGIQSRIEALQEQEKAIKAELLTHFPKDFGEHVLTFDGVEVCVKRTEKWTWNAAKIEDVLATKGFVTPPSFVKTTTTIDKKAFEQAPEAERDLFLDALTRGNGGVKISVKD